MRDAAALDLTLALGPFDTSPEIMCERGAGEGERLYTFGEPVRRWDEENSNSYELDRSFSFGRAGGR